MIISNMKFEMIANTSPGCAFFTMFQKLGKLCHPPDESMFKTARLNPDKNRSDQYLPCKLTLTCNFVCIIIIRFNGNYVCFYVADQWRVMLFHEHPGYIHASSIKV